MLKEPSFHIQDDNKSISNLNSFNRGEKDIPEFEPISRNNSWAPQSHILMKKLQVSKYIEDGEICNNLINNSLRSILENEEKFKKIDNSDVLTLKYSELTSLAEIKSEQVFSNEGFQKRQSRTFKELFEHSVMIF